MKKNPIYIALMALLVLSLMLPVSIVVAAQSGGSSSGSTGSQNQGAQNGDQDQDRDQIRDPSTNTITTTPIQDRDQDQDRDQIRLNTTTTSTTSDDDKDQDRDRDRDRERIHIDSEDVIYPATTTAQLKFMVQNRERELNREVEDGTTTDDQNIIRNTNQIRLAVHALLSAENLVGGIGPQISLLAREINNSSQDIVNSESKIVSRGFWARLFFGGDMDSATIIEERVAQITERINEIKKLMENVALSSEIRILLQERINVMEQEINRLSNLADEEKKDGGFFSWRFK